jgi:glycosyltransferase involved in cell wall biosynthesis
MNIGPVWILLDTSGMGGIETHVTTLVSSLRNRSIDAVIVLLTDHGPHPLEQTWHQMGLPVHKNRRGFRGLVSKLMKERPSLVHTHGYKAGILGRLVCVPLHIPVVSTYHAGEPGEGRVKIYNWFDRFTSGLATPIAVSQLISERIKADTTVIPNFVNVPSWKRSTGKTAAFVGRLSYEKGPDRFLELAKSLPDRQFEMFGDGPMFQKLSKKSNGSVVFRGPVSSMQPYWSHIGLLCITSRYEGLPLVALEAMSHGVPVVAFSVGALPDVIADSQNGYLIAEGDTKAMKRCIQAFYQLEADERAEMSMSARDSILEHFSSDVIIPQVLSVYENALMRIKSAHKSVSDQRPSGVVT